jgi:Fe-S cluster assembly protein SufD
LQIEVAAKLLKPIFVRFEDCEDDISARLQFVIREGADFQLLESYKKSQGFGNVAIDIEIEEGASVERIVFQAGGADVIQGIGCKVGLAKKAKFNQYALSFGSKLTRLETHIIHRDEDAFARLNSAYLLDDGKHSDMTSLVRHSAAKCVTEQSTKGALKRGGKGVFQGKFYVARGAQQTDAAMEHNALLLEDGAEVNAKPELEIYADDVQCAHGNTAGALDANALFYMRQRGITEKEAKAMLTQSFVAAAFDEMSRDDLADALLEEARKWLIQAL